MNIGILLDSTFHVVIDSNIWDVGGQKSLRSYWKNYFESTDGLIWVLDSTDIQRLQSCRSELINLIDEEVNSCVFILNEQ